MGHPIPLIVKQGASTREATEAELRSYATNNKTAYTKWVTANRIAYAKAQLESGIPHGPAWTDAFDRYPSEETRKNKPRFVMELP